MTSTTKQKAFVEAYLANGFNATQAAITAGYSKKTARSQGARLLTNVDIQAAVQARLGELAMSANEALYRLSEHARGSMADFLDDKRETLDLAAADRADKLHLIKKFSHTIGDKSENITIELYDAQSALVQILRERHLRAGEPTERLDVDDQKAREAREKLERALARIAERSG